MEELIADEHRNIEGGKINRRTVIQGLSVAAALPNANSWHPQFALNDTLSWNSTKHEPERWRHKDSIVETLIVKLTPDTHLDNSKFNRYLADYGAWLGKTIWEDRVYLLHLDADRSEVLARGLIENHMAEYAQPDVRRYPCISPNDANFSSQQIPNAIDLMNAWNITTGSASVAVAVLDMGIDTSHPDLRGKIDRGFNTIDGSSTVTPDATGHGTFCAGLIGAATNNSSQLAAIGWDTHVVPIKMAQYNDSDVISAIDWVRTNKAARIINMSFAGTGRPTQALIDAVNRAWAANIVLCASSGENNGSITPHYPAAMKPAFLPMAGHVVGVAGCNVFGRRFLNNNYGPWCDIAAPAQDYSLAEGGGINIFAGSSVACPVVCAVIALMVAANPHLTNAALVDILLRTGKPVTADFGMPSQPAVWIDAYSAVREAVAT